METGQSSTASPETTPQTPSETPAQQSLREGLSFRAGVTRLLGLFAAESIGRNLEAEDRSFDKFCNGPRQPDSPDGGADEMKIVSAGNVTINQLPKGSSGDQSALQPLKAGAGWFLKTLLAAGVASGCTGLGWIVNDLLKPEPPAAVDTDTITEMDFPE